MYLLQQHGKEVWTPCEKVSCVLKDELTYGKSPEKQHHKL